MPDNIDDTGQGISPEEDQEGLEAERSYARFLKIVRDNPALLDGDPATQQAEKVREKLHRLLAEAGEEADSTRLVGVCSTAFRALPAVDLGGDPSKMREYIEGLIAIDPRVALGAVFAMTQDACDRMDRMDACDRSSVLERTHELVRLLDTQCQGSRAALGLARLRTILRYMMEPDYTQNTTALELLCQGPMQCRDLKTRKRVTWQLELQPDDHVFDLGCGPGDTLDILKTMVKEKVEEEEEEKVHGIDINSLNEIKKGGKVRVGVIDIPQETLSCMEGGAFERLNVADYFGKCGLVCSFLVADRVASQQGWLTNCSRLLRPGGTLAIGLLLPVKCEDDELGLTHRFSYTVDPITVGAKKGEDLTLLYNHLDSLGFGPILFRRVPISDPVSGAEYKNHYLLIAQKRKETRAEGTEDDQKITNGTDEESAQPS